MSGSVFLFRAHINKLDAVWSVFNEFNKKIIINGAFILPLLDVGSRCGSFLFSFRRRFCFCQVVNGPGDIFLFPVNIAGSVDYDVGIAKIFRLPGGFMTEGSAKALAVKY